MTKQYKVTKITANFTSTPPLNDTYRECVKLALRAIYVDETNGKEAEYYITEV